MRAEGTAYVVQITGNKKIGIPMRYSNILGLALAAALLPAAASGAQKAAAPKSIWVCAGYFEKSIDRAEASYGIRNYRERFLATKKGALRRAVFVFPVAYRIMRDHLRSQAATRFGEESFEAIAAFDLSTDPTATGAASGKNAKKASGVSLQPGDQVAALPGAGSEAGTAAAARWMSKPYNGVPSKKGWSTLHMIALDGEKIVGRDSTLVVVWRYDSAEEWGTGESGSLLSFGRHRTGKTYVTSSEFGLMERLQKLYKTPFTVLPMSAAGPLRQETVALAAARDWLTRYADDPDEKLQANTPGGCGR